MAILTRQPPEAVPPRQFVAYAPEGQMIGVKDKVWFLREGLFAKYVISLVGLVVFVLAVNGSMETWISYRATRPRSPTPCRRRRRQPRSGSNNRSPSWNARSVG